MKLECYNKIVEKCRELKKRKCLPEISRLFPDVPRMTLESIIFQECQRKTKKSYYFHASPQNLKKYYERLMEESEKNWTSCGVLLKMADEVDLSPALMAKLILDYHYKENSSENQQESQAQVQKTKVKVNDLLKNPSLIDDPFLALEVKLCILEDDAYGHVSDMVRKFFGLEYENKLKDELTKLGFTFSDEHQLREKGYDKTPDIKLDVPIAVDGQIINWIESKASFGDKERHDEYLRDQYWSYCNRFGPGLVIYWAGYIDELNTNKEQGIMICDKLPTDIVKMDPSILNEEGHALRHLQDHMEK